MAIEKTRPRFWQEQRERLRAFFLSFPLPNVNPDVLSMSSVGMAILFVYALSRHDLLVAWIFLVVHLTLDGLDGAVAERFHVRKTKAQHRHGQIVDLTADRISEGIIFAWPPLFLFWFPLFLVNTVLACVQYRSQRALVLPLRQIFFIVFTLSLVF